MNTVTYPLETWITAEELAALAALQPIAEARDEVFQVKFAREQDLDSARMAIALRRSPRTSAVR